MREEMRMNKPNPTRMGQAVPPRADLCYWWRRASHRRARAHVGQAAPQASFLTTSLGPLAGIDNFKCDILASEGGGKA